MVSLSSYFLILSFSHIFLSPHFLISSYPLIFSYFLIPLFSLILRSHILISLYPHIPIFLYPHISLFWSKGICLGKKGYQTVCGLSTIGCTFMLWQTVACFDKYPVSVYVAVHLVSSMAVHPLSPVAVIPLNYVFNFSNVQ